MDFLNAFAGPLALVIGILLGARIIRLMLHLLRVFDDPSQDRVKFTPYLRCCECHALMLEEAFRVGSCTVCGSRSVYLSMEEV